MHCVVVVACNQLRTRDCHNCSFLLYCLGDPVVEMSTNCHFAPSTGSWPSLDQQYIRASLAPTDNHWREVFDFS